MKKGFWHGWRIGVLLITGGLIALWSICALFLEYSPAYVKPLKLLDSRLYDLQFSLRGPRLPSGEVVLVAIDDASFDRIGRWPWSRRIIADLYRKTANAGPRAVGITNSFTEPDTNTLVAPLESLRKEYEGLSDGKNQRFLDALKKQESLADTDAMLARSIMQFNKVVLAYRSQLRGETQEIGAGYEEELFSLVHPSVIKLLIFGDKHPVTVPHLVDVRPSIELISKATPHHGFLRYPVDLDGRIRFADMIYQHNGEYYPSFDILVASLSQNSLPGIRFGWRGVNNMFFGKEEVMVPVLPSGRTFINYLGNGVNFPTVSAVDVIEGRVPSLELKDKVVLIGVTSEAITRDLLPTPVGDLVPGLVVTASSVDMMIRDDFLSRPFWMIGVELFMLILVSLMLAAGLRGLGAWGGVLSTLFLIGGVVIVSHWVGFLNGYVVSLAPMLSCFSSIYLVLSVYNFFTEERKSAEVRNAFQHYLSPAVVQEILGKPEQLVLGGQKKILTVLFADVRNFTAMTEKLSPEVLTKLINDYFTEMTDIVFENQGLLDKYMGDALMAVFGAPVDNPEHPMLACRAAVQMVKRVEELNNSGILTEKLDIGVGVTTGEMIVGNMGSRDIFDYTVIGDTVNLGARIEKLNKIYRTKIMINSKTHERAASHIVSRDLDMIRVRGRAAPENIYELFGLKGEVDSKITDLTDLWREGLAHYRACNWERASQVFTRIVSLYPDDYPAHLYQKRCQHFVKNPPPKNWDGIFSIAV